MGRQPRLRACVLWIVLCAPFALHVPPADAQTTVDDVALGPVGPYERASNPITPDNPIPRRLRGELPAYPAAASDAQRIIVMMLVTLDGAGHIVEVRLRRPAAAGTPALVPFEQAALEAIQQWAYEPPVSPPITFRVAFSFGPRPAVALMAHESVSTVVPGLAAPPQVEEWRAATSRVPPRLISRPRVPRRSRDLNPGERQQVVVEIAIDARGRVSAVRVAHGDDRLGEAALDVARSLRFSPALADGQPIPFRVHFPIPFER